MDHKIEELDACIFDYLSSHPDIPRSFTQIFNDISGSTGHRCSQLMDLSNRKKYRDLFITTCYTMDNKWKNVHKIFKNDVPHLVFSTKSRSEVMLEFNNTKFYTDTYNGEMPYMLDTDIIEIDSAIDYMLDNDDMPYDFDFSLQLNPNENLVQYLVKKNKLDKLKKVLELFDVKLDEKFNGKTLVDTAIESGNIEMVKELMEFDFNNKKHELDRIITDLKKCNTILRDECKSSKSQNKALTKQMNNATMINGLWKMSTLFMAFLAFVMFMFK